MLLRSFQTSKKKIYNRLLIFENCHEVLLEVNYSPFFFENYRKSLTFEQNL